MCLWVGPVNSQGISGSKGLQEARVTQCPPGHQLGIFGTQLCYRPGFLASLINRNRSEARQEIQARLYWGPCRSPREQEQVTGFLAPSPGLGGMS